MTDRFAGKAALVTGAGSGTGAATAELLAAEGAAVALLARTPERVSQVAARIRTTGGVAVPIVGDVRSSSDVEHAVDLAVAAFGGLHYAVNTAGVTWRGRRAAMSDFARRNLISIHLCGVFYGLRFEIPAINAAGGGSIVNIANPLADPARGSGSATGSHGLTRTAAQEYGNLGIRINHLHQTYDGTAGAHRSAETTHATLPPGGAGGPINDAHQVAKAVAFLLSEDAAGLTGANVGIDVNHPAHV
jgi:NAD(P)-dependent dehydrogenase (short-subunit alcohol dehydrogenase family)